VTILSPQAVREVLDYDPATGVMVWRAGTKFAGKQAGCRQCGRRGKFYHVIVIGKKLFLRSRLAFAWMTGRWPEQVMDHISGNSLDDRWENLREASIAENVRNIGSKAKASDLPMGVRLNTSSGSYSARIQVAGATIYLGAFPTPDEASSAYQAARKLHFGRFAGPTAVPTPAKS